MDNINDLIGDAAKQLMAQADGIQNQKLKASAQSGHGRTPQHAACGCVLSFPMEIPLGWFAFGVVTRILLQGVSFCRFLTAQSTCGNKTKPQVDELKTITEKSKQNDPFDLRFQSLFLSLKTTYMSFDAVRRDSATAETRSHPPKRQGERAQECPKPDSRTRRARCPQKRLRRDLRQ